MARGEIGMAAVDLRHPNLVLCQFSDTLLYTHTLTKINFFNPIEASMKMFNTQRTQQMALLVHTFVFVHSYIAFERVLCGFVYRIKPNL